LQHAGEEIGAKLQSLHVDTMPEPWTNMPFDGKAGGTERGSGGMERKHGYGHVLVAMDKEDRRPVRSLGQMLRAGEVAGVADDPADRLLPPRSDMEGHHRALAEADEREVALREA